ncbi:MAG: EAL domain-containing response regulator [Candidatus Pelagadaptatus aseana]|uniref:EAL domain-containing response regulator n=1 Tax=Candidatus Pelagadaptatus aseana TaxID=3120508 RepID=UPI0039B199E3
MAFNISKETRCLIVDDSVSITSLLRGILKDECELSHVFTANSAERALELIDEGLPLDLIFLDLNMPGTDGIEFLRLIKKRKMDVAIILISGTSPKVIKTVESLVKMHRLDFIGSVPKPITVTSVVEVMQRYQELMGVHNRTEAYLNKVKVHELLRAIAEQQFQLYYQPIIDVHSRRLYSAEVLLRLHHPSRGVIYPQQFIETLENTDLIRPVTLFVIEGMLQQWRAWQEKGIDTHISFNISAGMLSTLEIPEYLIGKLEEYQVPASKVILEVTETGLVEDFTAVLEVLSRLSINGLKLAIDDFGAGFSTVERLQHLPFNVVKIDKQFMLELHRDESKRAAIESSISMARRLGMQVVVEGVETLSMWDVACHIGADFMQGYFVAQPLQPEAFESWHQSWEEGHT